MKKTNLLLTAAIVGLSLSGAQAQAIYSSGHADIGVGYDEITQEFEPHWHLHDGAVVNGNPIPDDEEYEADELKAWVTSTRTSPTGLSAAIGVADGTTIYAAGSSTYQPNLGFGAEELDILDWDGDITITLTGWTIPSGAGFALYTTNLAGTSVSDIVFSTVDVSSTFASNSFTLTPGDHVHFQWGFTGVGLYSLELTWTGEHEVHGLISTTETFTAQVVPEPSSAALLGIAGMVALALRRRRKIS